MGRRAVCQQHSQLSVPSMATEFKQVTVFHHWIGLSAGPFPSPPSRDCKTPRSRTGCACWFDGTDMGCACCDDDSHCGCCQA